MFGNWMEGNRALDKPCSLHCTSCRCGWLCPILCCFLPPSAQGAQFVLNWSAWTSAWMDKRVALGRRNSSGIKASARVLISSPQLPKAQLNPLPLHFLWSDGGFRCAKSVVFLFSRAFIVFVLLKCSAKWIRTPLMSSLGTNLISCEKCLSDPCGLVPCSHATAVLQQTWTLLPELQQMPAAAGSVESGFLHVMQPPWPSSCIVHLSKPLKCLSYTSGGELVCKSKEEKKSYFYKEMTELPAILDPKQCNWEKLLNHERNKQSVIFSVCFLPISNLYV